MDEIKLLLHRERPGVEKRGTLGGRRPVVSHLLPEQNIGTGERRSRPLLAVVERDRLVADCRTHQRCDQQHHQQGGQDPANPADPEPDQREGSLLLLAQDDGGEQKSGEHEKNIDPQIPAAQPEHSQMEQYDRRHGDRP